MHAMRRETRGERERKTDQEADVEDQERQGGKKVPRDGVEDEVGLVGRTEDSGGPMVLAIRQYLVTPSPPAPLL